MGRGADLPRLRDDEHAAIVSLLANRYAAIEWRTAPEASFSEWGERGRIDLFAAGVVGGVPRLHVVEVKVDLADLQDLFGSLDVKRRLAPAVARRLGWPGGEVSVVLAVASTAHNRAIVRRHAALFAGFDARTLGYGRVSLPAGWADRTLLWVPAPAASRASWLAGRRRVRARRASAPGRRQSGP
jgi:hypothetical protein